MKNILLFELMILHSICSCIGTTRLHGNKFWKAIIKLTRRIFDDEVPHRISASFANAAYRPELIDQSPLSWFSELNWIFHEELRLIFSNVCCKNLITIYYYVDYVDCLERVYIFNSTSKFTLRRFYWELQLLDSKSNVITTRL